SRAGGRDRRRIGLAGREIEPLGLGHRGRRAEGGGAARVRIDVAVEVEREHEIRLHAVGQLRPLLGRHVAIVTAGHHHADALALSDPFGIESGKAPTKTPPKRSRKRARARVTTTASSAWSAGNVSRVTLPSGDTRGLPTPPLTGSTTTRARRAS